MQVVVTMWSLRNSGRRYSQSVRVVSHARIGIGLALFQRMGRVWSVVRDLIGTTMQVGALDVRGGNNGCQDGEQGDGAESRAKHIRGLWEGVTRYLYVRGWYSFG